MDSQLQLEGRRIDDRYEVVRCLGLGGMGAVYEVRHLRLEKRFAMKVIRRDLAELEQFVARFEREALSTSKLEHPNCIAVTDYGRASTGELYLVMEFLEGRPLTSLLGKPLPVGKALEITRQILLALRHAHEAGVIHRDIKPDNVMLVDSADGRAGVKVVDFGLATMLDDSEEQRARRLTAAHTVIGTPRYMAPEQALGAPSDERSDLYAVGSILWYLLIGRPAFDGKTAVDLIDSKLKRPPPRLEDSAPGVFSPALQQLIARSLARDASERFASAEEFLTGLDRVLASPGGGLSVGRQRSLRGRLQGLIPRTPLALALAVVIACGLGAAIVFAVLATQGRPPNGRRSAGGSRQPSTSSEASGDATRQLAASEPTSPAGAAARAQQPIADAGAHGADTGAKGGAADEVATARLLVAARRQLRKGRCKQAADQLAALTRAQPKHARAHALLGSAEICVGKVDAGLAAYREAIALERGYRKDRRLLEDVAGLLWAAETRSKALHFLLVRVGKPAALTPLLGASTASDRSLRRAAITALEQLGAQDKIDWVTVYHLDLKQLPCKERRAVIAELTRLGDRRALGVLRDAARRRANRCVRDELRRAIASVKKRRKRRR